MARVSLSSRNGAMRFRSLRPTKKRSLKRVGKASPEKKGAAETGLARLPAIVINLDRRCDRWLGCSDRLKRHCPQLRFSRFRASDGRQDVIRASEVTNQWHTGRNVVYQKLRAMRKGWNDLDSYQEKVLELSPGERGCAMSHVRAWRRCVEKQMPLLVLEDDAAPTENFSEALERVLSNMPQDAQVLYLGYSQAAEWRRVVSPDLVEAEYVWTTVAYVIWPAGAQTLLELLPVDQPVDNFMAAACAAGRLKSYCMKQKLVFPAEAWNENSDIKHSDEADGDIHHSDLFYPGLPGPQAQASGIFYQGESDSDISDDEF